MFDVVPTSRRRPSISNSFSESLSTLESSAAADYLNQHQQSSDFNPLDVPNFVPNLSQNSVKIDHVREMNTIYNIYSTPLPSEFKTEENNANRDQQSSSESTTRGYTDGSQNQEASSSDESGLASPSGKPAKDFKLSLRRFISKRKYWIIGAGSVVIVMFIAWLIVYLITLKPGDNDLTTQIPSESTTTDYTRTTVDTTSSSTNGESTSGIDIKIYDRSDWGAEAPKTALKELSLPIKRIILAHTADENYPCFDFEECKSRVKKIQEYNSDLDDIPYNFLIGGDGSIFEGRGINFQGQHTSNLYGSSFDDIGICVAFIGTFKVSEPSEKQIEAFHNLVKFFINIDLINEKHNVFFQDELFEPNVPAYSLFETVKTFSNYYQGKLEWLK